MEVKASEAGPLTFQRAVIVRSRAVRGVMDSIGQSEVKDAV
jgi:hypothetical protein